MAIKGDVSTLETIERLLQVIVGLLLRRPVEQLLSLRQQIETLNTLGLRPKEIAKILGRSNIYINKELSELRKKTKQKDKHE